MADTGDDQRNDGGRSAGAETFPPAAGTAGPAGSLITAIPFGKEIGMRQHQAENGVAVLSVPYGESLVGDPDSGVLHGGVVTAIGFARAVAYHDTSDDPVATAQGAFILDRAPKEEA